MVPLVFLMQVCSVGTPMEIVVFFLGKHVNRYSIKHFNINSIMNLNANT